ncbi:hypothetical protein [Calidifontibacter terrae]
MSTDDPYRSSQSFEGDRTEELPASREPELGARTHSHERNEFPPPMTARPAQQATPMDGPVGALGPYAPPLAGEKNYGALLPALAAGLVGAGLTLVLGQTASSMNTRGGEWGSALRELAVFYDVRGYATTLKASTSAELVAALVIGVGCFVLTVLAAVSVRRVAARGLLFFAVWGIVAISATAAALAGSWVSAGSIRYHASELLAGATYGGLWGVVFGWIPALFAVVLRVGRRRQSV